MDTMNNWYEFLKNLIEKDFRLTVNGFASANDFPSFPTIMNKLKNNPEKSLSPETIGRIEKALNIEIDNYSDITDIKWKKNTPIEAVQPTSTAITNEQQLIAKIQQLEDENKQLKSTLATLQAVFNTLTH